jgi:hypothetical protein
MRAIPTLTNEWNTCEPNVSSQKLLSWYQTGYKQTGDGYPLSFRSFAQQIGAHYANEPTVAFWQLVNEAEAPSVNASGVNFCDSTAPNGLRSFSDDMATVLHQADPNHLVNLGTIGSGQCGLDGASYNYVHGGALDLCEYHDYGSAAQAVPSNGTNLLKERIDGCHALGKPIFVGEAGIAGNVQPNGAEQACLPWPNCGPYAVNAQTFQQRATFFQAKTQGGNTAGLVGYLIWFKSPYYSSSTDAMAIGDGDPTESTLAYALQPGSPAPSVPESPWPILLVITGTVAAAGVIALSVRRARRHVSAASA